MATTPFLTVAEVAANSGLSDQTVRDHIARGWLKAQQVGGPRGRIRVALADYYEWLNRSPIKVTERLEDTNWATPDPRYIDPNNDIEVCDGQTSWLTVHSSRLVEFGRRQAELGPTR